MMRGILDDILRATGFAAATVLALEQGGKKLESGETFVAWVFFGAAVLFQVCYFTLTFLIGGAFADATTHLRYRGLAHAVLLTMFLCISYAATSPAIEALSKTIFPTEAEQPQQGKQLPTEGG